MSVNDRNKRYQVSAGNKIYEKGKTINEVSIVVKGKASAVSEYNKTIFGAGTVLGLIAVAKDHYIFDYIAEEDCELFSYGTDENHDAEQVIKGNSHFSGLMVSTVAKQVTAMTAVYDDLVQQCSVLYDTLSECRNSYVSNCKKFSIIPNDFEEIKIEPFPEPMENVTIEKMDFCKNLNEIPSDILNPFFGANSSVTYYIITLISHLAVDLNETIINMIEYLNKNKTLLVGLDKKDLLYSYSQLAFEAGRKGVDISVIMRNIEKIIESVNEISSIKKEVAEQAIKNHKERIEFLYTASHENRREDDEFKLRLNYTEEEIEAAREAVKCSAITILKCAEMENEKGDMFIRLLTSYAALKDRDGTDEASVHIRKQLTEIFYEVYENVFFNYIDSGEKNTVIEMFLNFGYADERLLEDSQIIDLYYLAKTSGDSHIFMLKDWLEQIYRGNEEPSKSEFDIDYQENLREIKKGKLLTPQQEREYLNDQKGKVIYELKNMIKATNKITFGKISSFCPVLSSHNLSDDLQKAYVSSERINSIINKIKETDYSLFYRECMYTNDALGSGSERIMKEVLPYFILMPNFGSRCIMWQEIAGRKKDTPARIVLSVFTSEDLNESLMTAMAKFRWELCKSIQGVHWSDVTNRSLTSEYYDYLQFYKKNREISEKAKEKIKLALQRKANNFKDVFAADYVQWLKYEATGAARLNSFARAIMFEYCPFPKELRQQIEGNPTYSNIIKKFNIGRENKIKRYENVRTLILKNGGKLDEDFEKNLEFYKM